MIPKVHLLISHVTQCYGQDLSGLSLSFSCSLAPFYTLSAQRLPIGHRLPLVWRWRMNLVFVLLMPGHIAEDGLSPLTVQQTWSWSGTTVAQEVEMVVHWLKAHAIPVCHCAFGQDIKPIWSLMNESKCWLMVRGTDWHRLAATLASPSPLQCVKMQWSSHSPERDTVKFQKFHKWSICGSHVRYCLQSDQRTQFLHCVGQSETKRINFSSLTCFSAINLRNSFIYNTGWMREGLMIEWKE